MINIYLFNDYASLICIPRELYLCNSILLDVRYNITYLL
jgi:hypothetical protein